MELGLTNPLKRHLKIKNLLPLHGCELWHCWDLHLIFMHGKECLLAVHCASRYTFVVFDMAYHDWKDLNNTFLEGLCRSLEGAGFAKDFVQHCILSPVVPAFTKTHGRREVAFLNRAWVDVMALDYLIIKDQQFQPLLDNAVNQIPCRCGASSGLQTAMERLKLMKNEE